MKTTSRRKFLRNSSLVTSSVLVAGKLGANQKSTTRSAIGCAPQAAYFELTGTLTSVRSGNWSDTGTWGGKIPAAADTPVIASGHVINFDSASTTVAGININAGGTLKFDPTKSTVLQTTKNIIVQGLLQMQPGSASVIQTVRFTGINEAGFVGGGMDPLDSDTGLWVMGAGKLDLLGTAKTSWTRASNNINSGSSTLSLQTTTGWAVGDEITIAPTDAPTSSNMFSFEDKTITAVSGNNITLNSATARAHAMVNNLWSAEVINLTRNVRIEGTSTGKAHIFIRSTSVQTIRFAQVRYMGPRKDAGGDSAKELILGRYGMHFHHCMDGSLGSVVEGNVIRDTDSHAYVPHVSNGITFKNNGSYNTAETAYWWDEGELSHKVVYDGNIVAACRFVNRALALDTGDPTTPNFAGAAFLMGMGDDNVANGNVVVGCDTGDIGTGGAYFWQANNEGVWIFNNNMAHNNKNGLLTWQNSSKKHVIDNTIIYNCNTAIVHGAYANSYAYRGGAIYACSIEVEASSNDTNKVRFENIAFDGASIAPYGIGVKSSPIPANFPTFVRGCSFKGFTKAGVVDVAASEVKNIDMVQCTSTGTLAVVDAAASSSETIRIQPLSGQTTRLTKSGSSGIAAFAPTLWGSGGGLKGEYFNSNNFTNKVVERIDPVIAFSEWSTGVHYKLTSNTYTIRWTGKIQPQYSEAYTFQLQSGGGQRLYIDNKAVIDSFTDHYPDMAKSAAINLTAGTSYDIKIEYLNTDERSGLEFYWSSPSLPIEYVPQSQLYATAVVVTPPPDTTNQGPVADAGADQTITLPLNYAFFSGKGSDPDGTIVSYKWTNVTAPSRYDIQYPDRAETGAFNLSAGVYVFRLTVTDDKGATASDDVTVNVNATASANKPPTVNAGSDLSITLPVNYVFFSAAAAADSDGTIVSYKWTAVSAPSWYDIQYPDRLETGAFNMNAGTYVFRLTVTDNKGATASDDITVIVNPAGSTSQTTLNITASPNPTTTSFRITVTSQSSAAISVTIVDLAGNVKNTYANLTNNTSGTVGSDYPKGTYYAIAQQGNDKKTITLTKM